MALSSSFASTLWLLLLLPWPPTIIVAFWFTWCVLLLYYCYFIFILLPHRLGFSVLLLPPIIGISFLQRTLKLLCAGYYRRSLTAFIFFVKGKFKMSGERIFLYFHYGFTLDLYKCFFHMDSYSLISKRLNSNIFIWRPCYFFWTIRSSPNPVVSQWFFLLSKITFPP